MEEKGGETEDRLTGLEEDEKEKCEGEMPPDISTEEIQTEKETAGTIWTEEMDSGLEIEVEQGTEGEDMCRQTIDRKETEMQILATQEYKKNLDSPVGEELDFKQRGYSSTRKTHTLVAGGGWKRTCGICASGISHDHHRRNTTGRGKRHNQERGTQKEY